MEIAEKAARKLGEKRGEIALRLGLILLGAIMLFVLVFNIRHAYQVVDLVRDRTNEAVLSVAAVNGPSASGGVREGEAVSRTYTGASWQRGVTTDAVLDALQRSLGADRSGQSLVRKGSYRIDSLVTYYVNEDGDALHFTTTMRLTIFLMGGDALKVDKTLEVKTKYEAKF